MTLIHLYNTKTKTKEILHPIDEGRVGLYVCGPTVYDRAHLGNARPVVVFDILNRLLRSVYGEKQITYVRNFTDIDDKIIQKSITTGEHINDITENTIEWFLEDMKAIGNLDPDCMPRATDFIAEMITMIQKLVDSGHAYISAGHVLFDVSSFEKYGELSGRNIQDMLKAHRIDFQTYKRNQLDFVLWKPSDKTQPGWASPWGYGRPGWHIECSAMSHELLGANFDIHGGGNDLTFPHHENEIAQSCCATPGSSFANIWMHNEMLLINGKKMSKSLGNFLTVQDILKRGVSGDVIRFILLSTHYRNVIDWTDDKVNQYTLLLKKWSDITKNITYGEVDPEIISALSDDLNTPKAISILHKLTKDKNFSSLKSSLLFLGFQLNENQTDDKINSIIKNLVEKRNKARKNKDFMTSDQIRDGLKLAGVILKDNGIETSWDIPGVIDIDILETIV